MGMFEDALAWLDNRKRVMKRNFSDLVNDPVGTYQQIDDRAGNYNRQVVPTIQGGQLSNRPMTQDEVLQRDIEMAMNFMPMGVGATAYHGSPHKFDKFSLDKIGTGEGAQAYGHGLYLAESPEVARTYSADRAYVGKVMDGKSHNVDFTSPQWIAQNSADEMGGADAAISHLGKVLNQRRGLKAPGQAESNAQVQAAIDLLKSGQIATKGQLYKTDIPDEAVARFLDWDKPLSQQAPEVQKILSEKALLEGAPHWDGQIIYSQIADELGKVNNSRLRGTLFPGASEFAATKLKEAGIPGIRYLDGGSRSAGQGSSNFVAFDPEMIRILERNGQPTGLEPWKPGEYRLKDLIGKE